jgi:uroporphyrinogen-III synthase
MTRRLDGLGVVLTRPHRESERLAAILAAEGAHPFLFPALEIEAVAATPKLNAAIAELAGARLAIFVSVNAVEQGLAAVTRCGAWPAALRVAAVGDATAEALRTAGFKAVISPRERHDSDALLALGELQAVRGEAIIVFRGEGGRERLKDVLESRGARVVYAECYRRVRPRADATPLLEAWDRGEVHAVSALSAETLENFVALMGDKGREPLRRTPLLVPHGAIAGSPAARCFQRTVVTPPGNAALVAALSLLRRSP